MKFDENSSSNKLNKNIRYKKIGIHSYYDVGTDFNELGAIRFKKILKIAKDNSIRFLKYKFNKHNNYDAILLLDLPRPIDLIKIILKVRFQQHKKVILVLEETAIARKRFLIYIPFLFNGILINTIEEKLYNPFYPIYNYKHSILNDKETIAQSKVEILKGNRPKSICYIGKNNTAFSRLTTYSVKQKIISSFKNYPNKLSLYGINWGKTVIHMDFPYISIINRFTLIQKIIKFFISISIKLNDAKNISSLGFASSKLDIYSKHNFCLAFEPFIGRPYVILEKIFDPMKAGCIPIYLGHQHINKFIPSDIFIKIYPSDSAKEILERINKLNEQEIQSYRERIFNYLMSDEANQFRYEYVSNIFLNSLLKIINSK